MPKKITLCSQFHHLDNNMVHYLIAHLETCLSSSDILMGIKILSFIQNGWQRSSKRLLIEIGEYQCQGVVGNIFEKLLMQCILLFLTLSPVEVFKKKKHARFS